MSKADEMEKKYGESISQTVGVRPVADGMANVATAAPVKDSRREGLDRSKNSFKIPLDKIIALSQPREEFDEEKIDLLCNTLTIHGLIEPITVFWNDREGKYQIATGERRYRAAVKLGWSVIACNVLDKEPSADELLAIQCVENLMREDLKPMEQAKAFRTLLTVNGWPVTRIAKELGISHSAVSQSLRLLDLPGSVQEQVEAGHLSPVAGYHVAKIADPVKQVEVAERIVAEDLTRDETVEVVRQVIEAEPAKPRAKGGKGRGGKAKPKGKPKLVTERTIKAADGYRVTVERKKGMDTAGMLGALLEAVRMLQDEAAAGHGGDGSGELAERQEVA